MKIKFKKLHEDAVLPSYAKAGDAGLDLTAVSNGKVFTNSEGNDLWYYIEYRTGLAVEIDPGYVGLIFPRSSISKSSLILANSVAVIDSSYRGELLLRFKIDSSLVEDSDGEEGGKRPSCYKKGDRIAQLMVVPYPTLEPELVDEISETERGVGGFGSTGG
jgi:dUTP pyrophosphatase